MTVLEDGEKQQPVPARPPEDKEQPVLLSLVNFADSTSAHGFSRLVAPTGRLGSSLWLLFLLGAYAGLGFHTSTLVQKYVSHPVSTSLIAELNYEYPDIYLCNSNPVGYSRITKSIKNPGDYAAVYDANITAYVERLRQDVVNNAPTQAAVEILNAWLKWQTEILQTRVNIAPDQLTSCRISLQGSEFTGNYSSSLAYDNDMQPIRTPCISWAAAKKRLQTISPPMAALVSNHSHSLCLHNSSINVTAVKLLLGTYNDLNAYAAMFHQGPFCFHNSSNSSTGLDINYCGVPFCSKKDNGLANCSTSAAGDVSIMYMGPVQASKSGKRCLPWQDLASGSLNNKFANLKSSHQFKVILPDPEPLSVTGSSCRKAAVFFKDLGSTGGWQPINRLIIDSDVENESYCLVEAPTAKNLTMESCIVPDCSTSLKCISGLLHLKYGPHVLSKLVGPSLDINLLDCSFGSRKCTTADFTAFHHPYYGVCYKFNSDSFTRNLSPMQRGLRPLNLKLFADDHDHMGNRRQDTYPAVRAVMGGPYNTGGSELASFNLFVMPTDFYPGTPNAIKVHTATHTTIRTSYKVSKDLTTRGVCHTGSDMLEYNIYSWDPTVMRPRGEQSFSTLDGYFRQFNSTSWSFARNQEACANLAVVEIFVQKCQCLPYNLPVPTKFQGVPYCFWLNDSSQNPVRELMNQEICAMEQFSQLETLIEESWRNCRPKCDKPYYENQMITQPWPDASHASYNVTIQSLMSLIGFPKQVSPDEGLAMLYHSYLQGSSLISPSSLQDFGGALAMREAARSNLAWVTVEAEYPIGSGTNQEDGYTMANMLAELGGILGLYCGVSVLTICELMDLAGRLMYRAFMRSARSSPRVGDTETKQRLG